MRQLEREDEQRIAATQTLPSTTLYWLVGGVLLMNVGALAFWLFHC